MVTIIPIRAFARATAIASRSHVSKPSTITTTRRLFSNSPNIHSRDVKASTSVSPPPPEAEKDRLKDPAAPATYLGTTKRLPEFSLHGKVVLVTGAARNLGLTQAEALLEAGAQVYALDRAEEPSEDFFKVQKRAKEELGTKLEYRRIDVRNTDELNKIIGKIASDHGRLDGLIAAAGVQQETPAIDYKAEDANWMFETNVTGVFMTAQAAARQMIKYGNGGSIALIASMSGTVANRGMLSPTYNASKGAVIQLARNLAMEWGPHKIRVNTISPGYILTKMLTDLFIQYPEREKQYPQENMLGRFSTPEEYRGAATFLISDASSFMTGSDLRIDGGHCAW